MKSALPGIGLVALAVALAAGLAGGATAVAAQEGTPPRDRVDSLAAAGMLQEAAWAAREAGDTARGARLLDRLETILRAPPVRARPLAMDSQGVSYTFRLDHGDRVESIFKVDSSDIFCRACGADREVAAYQVDRLLGLDLTPMTIHTPIVDRGDTMPGSAMYFVDGAARPSEVGDPPKPDRLRFFDALLGNSDRHGSNWLVLRDGRIVAIDHNRAFQYRASNPKTCWETEIDSIAEPDRLGEPYRRYRTLPDDSLVAAMDGLAPDLVRTFLEMRPLVVDRIERRIRRPRERLPHTDCRP